MIESRSVLILLCLVTAGCAEAPPQQPPAQVSPPAAPVATTCPVARGDLRLSSATAGGLPLTLTIAELRDLCRSARVDTVSIGGTTAVGLTVTAPGAAISAVQTKYDAYGDSLHAKERADLWVALGDSLRFPDGALVPQTVGGFRKLDSVAVVVVDHGDDGTGSYIVRCRYPFLRAIVDNVWPSFADSGIVSFKRASASDTVRIWRLEQDVGPPSQEVAAACSAMQVPPTNAGADKGGH
jgi:hypothetical protein